MVRSYSDRKPDAAKHRFYWKRRREAPKAEGGTQRAEAGFVTAEIEVGLSPVLAERSARVRARVEEAGSAAVARLRRGLTPLETPVQPLPEAAL